MKRAPKAFGVHAWNVVIEMSVMFHLVWDVLKSWTVTARVAARAGNDRRGSRRKLCACQARQRSKAIAGTFGDETLTHYPSRQWNPGAGIVRYANQCVLSRCSGLDAFSRQSETSFHHEKTIVALREKVFLVKGTFY